MVRTATATAKATKAQYVLTVSSVTERMCAAAPNTIIEKRVTATRKRIFSLFGSYKNRKNIHNNPNRMIPTTENAIVLGRSGKQETMAWGGKVE